MKRIVFLFLFISLLSSTALIAQINFSSTGLNGVSITNPTSLDFGPDGRLYVSVQSGEIYAYTVQRQSANSYTVVATETILAIKQIQNHDDDGALHNVVKRQITGILADGTAVNPVLYVSSSDYRIGGGGGGSDKNLDSNSGIVSKLVWDGSQWVKVDLVRGLPRSEENHATNGMQLDANTNTLYLAVGGNTNAGSPSNNFAFLNEYALSAAIVSIDLNDLDSRPILTDAQGAKYVYDLPTLDDPSRPNANGISDPNTAGYNGIDVNDPFGGNDGLNQAKWTVNSPVQVYASGFRNAYDLVLTDDGRMYTWDNGANQGWGGHPANEGVGTATNDWVPGEPGSTGPGPNDAKVNNKDGLHFISGPGYYGGHPNPVRANPSGAGLFTHDHANGSGGFNGVWRNSISSNTSTTLPVDWPPVDLALAHPVEGDFQNAGVDDLSIYTITASTNGMAEYKASNFNNTMNGDLLAASFNGNIYRVSLNAQGSINSAADVTVLATGFGAVPLDVTSQNDAEIFPGTIWAATYGSNAITIFEPQDFANCSGAYDPNLDEDNDGYTNADEIDNQTNPCSGASFPSDFDQSLINGFKVSDLNDPDDDDDGLADSLDAFALDPANGSNLNLVFDYPLLNGDPGFGLYGLGFTGFMSNGSDDYLNLYYTEDNSNVEIIAGGAVGLLSFNDAPSGSPFNAANDLKNGFQFGLNVNANTLPFEIEAALVGPLMQSNPQGDQFHAFYIGTGDQDNFFMFGANANQGNLVLSIWIEQNGNLSQTNYTIPGLGAASEVSLFLELNPLNQSIQAKIDLGNGLQNVGSSFAFPAFMANIFNGNEALALGVAAGKDAADPSFNATYDYIKATYIPNNLSGNWTYLHDGTNCSSSGNQSSCPQGRHEAAYVEVGNKFVLIGGKEHGSNANIFDPTTGIWTLGAAAPIDLHHFQAIEYNGLVYALMGMTGTFPNETPVEHIYIYDPLIDQWFEGPEIPASRRRGSAGAVKYNNKIYLVGGIQNGHTSGWVPWMDEFDPRTNTWSQLPDAPRPRDHFHAIESNAKLYAAGGRNSGASGFFGATIGEVDVFDFASNTWSTLPNNVPMKVAGAAVAHIGDELILIGGENSLTAASNLSQALNLSQGTWRNLDSLNTGRHGTQAIVNNQAIYLASGSDVQGAGTLLSQEVFSFGNPQAPILNPSIKGSLAGPVLIDFGSLGSQQSAQKTIYLKNANGNQGFLIDTVYFKNGSAGLNFNGLAAYPALLTAGDSIALNILFAGSSNLEDTLVLISSALNQNLQIPVNAEVLIADAIRINCGGPSYVAQDGAEYDADQFFLNGSTFSKVIGISNTSDPAIYHTERWAENLAYSIPVDANGSYQVDLHFAEIYSPNFVSGARIMDISMEGQLVQSALDIYDTVGGYAALVKSYTVNITDGSLDLNIAGVVENAKLSAISISPSGGGLQFNPANHHFQATALGISDSVNVSLVNSSTSLISIDSVQIIGAQKADFSHNINPGTAIPAAYSLALNMYFNPSSNTPVVRTAQVQVYYDGRSLPLVFNISGEAACPIAGSSCDDGDPNTQNDVNDGNCNCSGTPISNPSYSLYINAGGAEYTAADGKTFIADQYFLNGKTSGAPQSIANTLDDELFSTERWAADLAYAIPLPQAGTYQVSLYFAEIWSGAFGNGKREFSMWLEDSMVIEDLDIHAAAGPQTALILSFIISVDDTLNLSSLASINNAKLSAIGLEYIPSGTTLQGPMLSVSNLSFPARSSQNLDSLSFYVVNPDTLAYSLDSVQFMGSASNVFTASGANLIPAQDSSLFWLYFNPQAQSPANFVATAKFHFANADTVLTLAIDAVLSCPAAGTACDDGDSTTLNDQEDGSCNCLGTPIPSPNFSLNINCGGPAYTSAFSGKEFLADQYNIGGYTHSYSGSIVNASDSTIYSTCRIGRNMSYAIPLDVATTYEVTLHFAEVQNWLMHPNKRIFDISAEGQLVIDDLDLVSETGSGASAYSKTFRVEVLDGILNLNTAASKDNSILMAIEISDVLTSPESLLIDKEQITLSAIVGQQDSASFYFISQDSVVRSIDSLQMTGTAALYVQNSIVIGSSLNPADSLLTWLHYSAPSSPISNQQMDFIYFSNGDTLIQTLNISALCRPAGTACDDGDANTVNDIEDGQCNCAGTSINNPSPAFSLNINCGGSALISPISGKNYLADQYNIGGYTHSYSDGVANTLDSSLYSTARIGRNMSYNIPIPNAGDYTITLHFAELQSWLMGPNRRLFDISVEGQLILDDLDIFSQSGAGASAYQYQFQAQVNDGELNINTAASIDNSLLVAIEIESIDPVMAAGLFLSSNSIQIVAPVNQQQSEGFYLINGDSIDRDIDSIQFQGFAQSYVQSSLQSGDLLNPDDSLWVQIDFTAPNSALNNALVEVYYFSNQDTLVQELVLTSTCPIAGSTCDDGDPNTINDVEDGNCNCAGSAANANFSLNVNCGGPAYISPFTGISYVADQYNIGGYTHSYANGVDNTSDSVLYSTCRIGKNMSYHMAVPTEGLYEVKLHFAELQGWLMGPNRRVFDISAEGQLVLDDLDIYTLSGDGASAYSETFNIEVLDGELDLNTAASKDNSLLVAIEVKQLSTNSKRLSQEEELTLKGWAIFPNPLNSGQDLNLHLETSSASTLRIINQYGAVIVEQNLPEGGKHHLSALKLNPGVYLVELFQNGKHQYKKLLVN